jgi:catechol 2,3-dioxygenase-like lactoylglutathione lyase family enzyme
MSAAEEHRCAPTVFGGVTPVFRVSDLQASINYYVNALGFKVDWQHEDFFASVSRDRCGIFLSVGDQGHPGTWVWIGVGNIEMVCDELRKKGANIRHPPTNYPWALEMQVEDPDGNVLRIGSEQREGEPYGEWLDMHGDRWIAGKRVKAD